MIRSAQRRQFLKQATVGAASILSLPVLPFPGQAVEKKKRMLPIVDTHQHLWDLTRQRPPWLDGAPEVLRQSYITSDYLSATADLNVVKAVYMEVDVAPQQQVAEAEHVISLCRSSDHPTAGAVISGRPNSAGFAQYMQQFRNNAYVKGIRQVLHVPEAKEKLCLEAQFVQSIRLLGEMGKSFDLCMRPTELLDGLKLAEKCPDTRFVLDHCGNADPKAFLKEPKEEPWHGAQQWKRDLSRLAACTNIICKISGIVARVPGPDWDAAMLAPIVNHCLDEFGEDRVVFGGDWPVCLLGSSYRGWVKALKQVIENRSQRSQRKLLHDNAESFYSLASVER